MEEEENSSFVSKHGNFRDKDGFEVKYFNCNRSGSYRTSRGQQERRRRMKSQGLYQKRIQTD